MTYDELCDGVWQNCRDEKRSRIDPATIVWRVNEALEQYAQDTLIVRVRRTITITSGSGNLQPDPDSVGIANQIVRVEDPARNNRALLPITVAELDSTVGLGWRDHTTGPLKYYYRGTPASSTQDGFKTLGVYPAIASGSVAVDYIGSPRHVFHNTDPQDLPDNLLLGVVYGAALAILAIEGLPELQSQQAYVKAQYDKWVAIGVAQLPKVA